MFVLEAARSYKSSYAKSSSVYKKQSYVLMRFYNNGSVKDTDVLDS